MPVEPVLIAGEWRPARNPAGSFVAIDPATGRPLDQTYPVSSRDDIELALAAAAGDAYELARAPERLARFLELYADAIEARADALVETAHRETALPAEPRLRSGELPRTTNQLRQAAAAARDGSFRRATIDTKNGIRSMFGPLGGPVVVLGPNNFPFAFNSISGGDFATAIATGNPVIAKANPGHPGTTKLLAEAALEASKAGALPSGAVQLVYQTSPDVGLWLVAEPRVGATAFTGSKRAGLALKRAADAAGKPIYLEMSSINPVFVLPGALEERAATLAEELFGSCSLGAGQFCTNPGISIVVEGDGASAFFDALSQRFAAAKPGTLLGPGVARGIAEALDVLTRHGAKLVTGGRPVDGPGSAFENTLLRVSGAAFLAAPRALQTEAFGTVHLTVIANDTDELLRIAAALEGNLTASVYGHTGSADDAVYEKLQPILRHKVGRLLNDKMPTGVAVSPAMNHGGPYPATGHPGFTAVGIPASLVRFCALHCYDNVRAERLPPELHDRNPTGSLWRLVDGDWTQRDVG